MLHVLPYILFSTLKQRLSYYTNVIHTFQLRTFKSQSFYLTFFDNCVYDKNTTEMAPHFSKKYTILPFLKEDFYDDFSTYCYRTNKPR